MVLAVLDLLADPVVEVGREEAGLVAYVVAVAAVLAAGIEDGREEEVEAFFEEVFAADLCDEAARVLRDVERVGPGAGFVEVVLVPGSDEARVEGFFPAAVVVLHPDEAFDVAVFGVVDGVGAPELLPVAGALGEELAHRRCGRDPWPSRRRRSRWRSTPWSGSRDGRGRRA